VVSSLAEEASFQVVEYSPAVLEEAVVPSSGLVQVLHRPVVHQQTADVVGLHATVDSAKPADVLRHEHRQNKYTSPHKMQKHTMDMLG